MEVNSFSSDLAVFGKIVMNSVLEAVVAETLLIAQRSVASLPLMGKGLSLVLLMKMVPKYTLSPLFSFMITCMAILARAELTKVPLRPYLRGNPGLLPQTISSRDDSSVVKRVDGCKGQAGCLLKDGAPLPELVSPAPLSEFESIAPLSEFVSIEKRFPFEALLNQKNKACPENKDGSDTEDDDEDDGGDAEEQDDDDDANDEDFSGEEGEDDDDEGEDPEEDPAANGNGGSDDDEDDDDDGDDNDDDEEEEEEDDEEEEDQPPAKKRK